MSSTQTVQKREQALGLVDGLISEDFTRLVVPGPARATTRGAAASNWTLDLAEGWSLEPGTRPGSWRVVQSPR